MNPCFENLVGIRTACGDQIPSDSDLYIQDLPYINLKLADALVTDQASGVELLQDLYRISVAYLENDARTRMNPYFKRVSVMENNIAGYSPLNRTLVSGVANRVKGIQIQVRQSTYLDVFLPSLTLWVNYTGTVPVKIWNLTTGVLLDTIDVITVAGEPTIIPTLYKNYSSNGQALNLFIGYDTTDIDSYQMSIYNMVLPNYYGGCMSCLNTPSSRWLGNKYVWLFSPTVAVGATKLQANLSAGNDTGGLSVNYTLNCSLDKWLCTMRKDYAFALMHKWGVEILKESLVSNRLNTLVTLKKEDKERLKIDYENEYQKGMENSFRNLKLPNDPCFVCNQHILTGITIP